MASFVGLFFFLLQTGSVKIFSLTRLYKLTLTVCIRVPYFQAMEDKKMRSYAVIPPLMLDAKQRRCVFYNENGSMNDMEADFKVCQ